MPRSLLSCVGKEPEGCSHLLLPHKAGRRHCFQQEFTVLALALNGLGHGFIRGPFPTPGYCPSCNQMRCWSAAAPAVKGTGLVAGCSLEGSQLRYLFLSLIQNSLGLLTVRAHGKACLSTGAGGGGRGHRRFSEAAGLVGCFLTCVRSTEQETPFRLPCL